MTNTRNADSVMPSGIATRPASPPSNPVSINVSLATWAGVAPRARSVASSRARSRDSAIKAPAIPKAATIKANSLSTDVISNVRSKMARLVSRSARVDRMVTFSSGPSVSLTRAISASGVTPVAA